jgi:hypothetical protein
MFGLAAVTVWAGVVSYSQVQEIKLAGAIENSRQAANDSQLSIAAANGYILVRYYPPNDVIAKRRAEAAVPAERDYSHQAGSRDRRLIEPAIGFMESDQVYFLQSESPRFDDRARVLSAAEARAILGPRADDLLAVARQRFDATPARSIDPALLAAKLGVQQRVATR